MMAHTFSHVLITFFGNNVVAMVQGGEAGQRSNQNRVMW